MLRDQLGDDGQIGKAVPDEINARLIRHVGDAMRGLDLLENPMIHPVSTPVPKIYQGTV